MPESLVKLMNLSTIYAERETTVDQTAVRRRRGRRGRRRP
jgi:hypothetical protein